MYATYPVSTPVRHYARRSFQLPATTIRPQSFIEGGYADRAEMVYIKAYSALSPVVQVLSIHKLEGNQYRATCFVPAVNRIKELTISGTQPLVVVGG